MQPSLVLALAAALAALPAQDQRAAAATPELPQLRAAFAAAQGCERAIVIAVVRGGEPVILTGGSDAAGNELTPQTVVPLLALAKVLAADAIHIQQKGKIDKGSGEKLGDRELTVRDLLDGVPQLPDFCVFDGGDDAIDPALLRTCGAMAERGGMSLSTGRLGAPEFVLLEPLAIADRHQDWSSMLRLTLAPHVPGLDPLSADALGDTMRSHTTLAAEGLVKLATARPAVLRTMLSLQNLGTWMQWRTGPAASLWAGARMGRIAPSLTRPKDSSWMMACTAFGVSMALTQYPSHQAAMLWILPRENGALIRPLRLAFEDDLYANEDEAAARDVQQELRAKLGAALAAAPRGTAPGALDGSRWAAATVDGKTSVRLAFGNGPKEPVALSLDSEVLTFQLAPAGNGLRATSVRRGNSMFWLWLLPEPDAEKPTKLACVLIRSRTADDDPSSIGTTASVPRYFELSPAKN